MAAPGAAPADALADAERHRADLHQSAEAIVDPLGLAAPIAHAALAWWLHPLEAAERSRRFAVELEALVLHALARFAGSKAPDLVAADPDDARFGAPEWTAQAGPDVLKQWYLFWTRQIQDAIYATPGLSPKEKRRAAFWSRQWLNAAAPSNFLATNPVALRKAAETRGESLARGLGVFLKDLAAGTIRMTEPEDFAVGGNLATTPGAVVFRNRLIELIHYRPAAGRVRPVPVVIVPPWINKFYVLDLDARKSLVRYLVEHGFDTYIVSWKNPGEATGPASFDDYLTEGVDEAMRVARAVSGSEKTHAVGYCIGGTLLSSYMAWLARRHPREKMPVAHWTLFASLVDFQSPGDIEVFIDEGSVDYLCNLMRLRGHLDGAEMAMTFRLLRANPLIWHYVVHGWLYGEPPPASDVLYWNMDTTRMPAAMHEFYLREMYLANKLVRPDALTIAGEPIDLARIHQDLYAVSSEDDHITPWRQVFRINGHVTGHKRFVLSSSGHILGIVNPPVTPPKRHYRAGPAHRGQAADAWLATVEQRAGSWWEDWSAWLAERCGEPAAPPPLFTEQFQKLADAPGTYVLER
ncbi:MAG TPA: alpha/beta fold hydrolase, partial [Burkholderiales bacterium]